jgi:tRNA A-37 threonylcarbamoyl transferase component Bud32
VDVLILDLCDGILNEWEELSDPERSVVAIMPKQLLLLTNMISCRSQVSKLVQDLHHIGIVHEDLGPRNIARAREGGFCLIDFSESRRHICKESKVRVVGEETGTDTV